MVKFLGCGCRSTAKSRRRRRPTVAGPRAVRPAPSHAAPRRPARPSQTSSTRRCGRVAPANLLRQETFSDADIIYLLGLTDPADCEALRRASFDLTTRLLGDNVHYRGIVEFSNVCRLNCRYCGIRKSNRSVPRYALSKAQIVESALWAAENNYGSICLQSGERRDEKFIRFVEDCIGEIRRKSASEKLPHGLSITFRWASRT